MKLQFLLVGIIASIQVNDGCRDMDYLDCIQNKTMTGHVIKSSVVAIPALQMCQNNCFHEEQCVSYNLGPVDGAIRTCELNSADHWMRPGSLVSKQGYEYCPIQNPCSSSPCPVGSLCTPNFDWDTYSCDDCPARPLGMENHQIQDHQINASSYWDLYHAPYFARLNNMVQQDGGRGTWSTKNIATGEWIQVDLENVTIVTKVATQGRPEDLNQWVTKYAVTFSNDGVNWANDQQVQIYNANKDHDTIVTNTLVSPIMARYIRLIVKGFNQHPSMRMELYGCSL